MKKQNVVGSTPTCINVSIFTTQSTEVIAYDFAPNRAAN
jgi:hypothetical protein